MRSIIFLMFLGLDLFMRTQDEPMRMPVMPVASHIIATEVRGRCRPMKRASSGYDRKAYGSWADTDGDCKSTRHEVLEQLNTGRLRYSANGCRVVSGRWFGVFSGQYFYDAQDMDIDHVFPVALADRLGARDRH